MQTRSLLIIPQLVVVMTVVKEEAKVVVADDEYQVEKKDEHASKLSSHCLKPMFRNVSYSHALDKQRGHQH